MLWVIVIHKHLINIWIIIFFYLDFSPCVNSPPRTPLGVLNSDLSTPNSRSASASKTGSSRSLGNTPRTPAEERIFKKVSYSCIPRIYLEILIFLTPYGLHFSICLRGGPNFLFFSYQVKLKVCLTTFCK